MAEYPGDISMAVDWIDRALLGRAEKAIFGGEAPSLNHLTGVFYDEYTRLKKGPWARLHDTDYTAFMIRFGEWLEETRYTHPHEYLEGLIRHVVTNRMEIPVIVFDNTDHFPIDFQQTVYQYARSLYEKVVCLVIL